MEKALVDLDQIKEEVYQQVSNPIFAKENVVLTVHMVQVTNEINLDSM